MYNLLLAVLAAVVTFTASAIVFSPVAGVLPALLVLGLALFLLARRTGALVQAELAALAPLLQARKVDEAVTLLNGVKERYGRWQFLLAGQIDAQLGMMDYLQMRWDDARPKLEAGKWRNWAALTCLGCIHYRQGRKAEAWASFSAAADAASKETMIYAVWATLLVRDGLRKEALEALARGLEAQKDSQMLKELQAKVANQKKVDTAAFGDAWYQFFPEDLMKEMAMRGRRGAGPMGAPQAPQAPRIGARHAPRR